jgi:hypothetical protein
VRVRVKVLGLAGGKGILGAGEHPIIGELPGSEVRTLSLRSFVQLCGNAVLVVSILHFRSHLIAKSSSSRHNGIGFVFMENDLSRRCTGVVLGLVLDVFGVSRPNLAVSKDDKRLELTVM